MGTDIHQNSLVSDRHPKYFEWVSAEGLATFYTYTNFDEIDQYKDEDRYAILLESSSIVPDKVEWLHNNSHLFNKIFTHNSDILRACSNARWIPGGGIWVGTPFGGGEVKLYEKRKLISMVSSDKTMVPLHVFRAKLAHYLHTRYYGDVYGTLVGKFVKPSEYLVEYMFSVIIENNIDDLYFTEKLLNCFATGTIPIYCGARDIGKIFDTNGILTFGSYNEFFDIYYTLSEDLYNSKLKAVQRNFELCSQFACPEDYMWEHYLKEDL